MGKNTFKYVKIIFILLLVCLIFIQILYNHLYNQTYTYNLKEQNFVLNRVIIKNNGTRNSESGPIKIEGRQGFSSSNYVTNPNANGTKLDPYIIEELDINGTGYSYCLYIGNTTKYFIIKNSHFLNSEGEAGIFLFNADNGIIRNNTIQSNTHGILLWDSKNNIIENNNCSNNYGNGIYIYNSCNFNIIKNNNCSLNGADGIFLDADGNFIDASNNTIKENTLYFNKNYGIHFDFVNNNIIENNICSNNHHSILLSSSNYNFIKENICIKNKFDGIFLTNSKNNLIQKNFCNNNKNGINIYYDKSERNILENNSCFNNEFGIGIYSPNNKLYSNKMKNCSIYIKPESNIIKRQEISDNNTVNNKPVYYYNSGNMSNEKVPFDAGEVILGGVSRLKIENLSISYGSIGILIGHSYDLFITNNTCINNKIGMSLYCGHRNILEKNNCSFNDQDGISISYSSNNTIVNNIFYANKNNGISLADYSNNNEIIYNSIIKNKGYGFEIISDFCKGNLIHHNNFINNAGGSKQAIDFTINNTWDDAISEGNYWSDYLGADNGSNGQIKGDGIGDTLIPHLGLDNYPLMNQITIEEIEKDSDFDEIYDYFDIDDDNDGFNDVIEIQENTNPLENTSKPNDLDKDYIPDSWDDDIDGDGYLNDNDDFPSDPNKWKKEKKDANGFIPGFEVIILIIVFGIVSIITRKSLKLKK